MAANTLLWLLLHAGCASGLIILAPPASDETYYNSKRDDLYSFTNVFRLAANATGEPMLPVADEQVHRDLHELYGAIDALRASLGDVWMRDFYVTQLSDSVVVRFKYEPAYVDTATTGFIDISTREFINATNMAVTELDLVLDGGGIVWEPSTRRAVLTERVLRDNPWLVGKASLSFGGALPGQQNPYRNYDNPYIGAPAINASELAAGEAAVAGILSTALGGASVEVAILPEEPGAPRLPFETATPAAAGGRAGVCALGRAHFLEHNALAVRRAAEGVALELRAEVALLVRLVGPSVLDAHGPQLARRSEATNPTVRLHELGRVHHFCPCETGTLLPTKPAEADIRHALERRQDDGRRKPQIANFCQLRRTASRSAQEHRPQIYAPSEPGAASRSANEHGHRAHTADACHVSVTRLKITLRRAHLTCSPLNT